MEPIHSSTFMISGIATGLIALIFAVTAHHKIFNMFEIQGVVRDYRLLPTFLVKPVTLMITMTEIGTVILLVIPTTRLIGATSAILMLAVYTFAIAINLLRGRVTIDCGCGAGGQGISWFHVLRNTIYSTFPLLIIALPIESVPSLNAAITSLFCIAMLWLIVVFFEQLLKTKAHIIVSESQ